MKKLLLFSTISISACFFGLFFFVFWNACFHQFGSDYTDSMEPTFMVGDLAFTNIFDSSPNIGDMIQFDCIKGTCGLGAGNEPKQIIHRLTAISPTGCMTIIGDNPKYDWSKVPCYMPGVDIEIIGVVHKL